MKQIICTFLMTIFFSIAIYPQAIQSTYTDLTESKCKTIESVEKGDMWYRAECAGVASYKLEVIEGDARMSLNVISPNGKKSELDFDKNVSSAFSSLGEKAEWRITRKGKKVTPLALIVRFEISEPDHPTNPGNKSFLVVIKIKPDMVCITDVVKPIKNQNLTARKLADVAGSKPCVAEHL